MDNIQSFDVLVVGGGIAGVSAALSAARMGKRVAIIEKNAYLGGLAVSGLINWFEPLCDGKGKQVIYSQAEELLKLAIKYGYKSVDDNWLKSHKGNDRYATWFDHNLFSLSMLKLLNENNVKIYFETVVTDAIFKNKKIDKVYGYNVSGRIEFSASNFIDASGSAYLCRILKLDTVKGKNYLTYVTTTMNNEFNPIMQYCGAFLDGTNHPRDCRYFVGDNTEDVNEYLLKSQLLTLKNYEEGKLKKIVNLPSQSQFRKICCLVGEYVLNENDKCKFFSDSIGCIGVFNNPGSWYEIPIRCLYSNNIKNLFVCGRIISSVGDAWEATRVIPVCCLTGEAAGILSANNSTSYKKYIIEANKRQINIHF